MLELFRFCTHKKFNKVKRYRKTLSILFRRKKKSVSHLQSHILKVIKLNIT